MICRHGNAAGQALMFFLLILLFLFLERSVFGFSLCVSAILMLALQVIRFEEVRQSCKKYRQDW